MSPRGFDAELAQLETLRDAAPTSTLAPLRKAITSKNSFIVAKAAALIVRHNHHSLLLDLAAAYPRFSDQKVDPQCWAREALAKALAAFDFQEPAIFSQGMRTFVPGFSGDAATALRGTCALALVQCRGLSNRDVLTHLLPLFTDKELPVRVNAARAIEQIGTETSSMLLRLRAELASDEPALLGACYSGVLHLEGQSALSWVGKFLHPDLPDEACAEAAFAIAETRTEPAATLLRSTYKETRDKNFRQTLLTALALTRQDTAVDFLLELVAEGNEAARQALIDSAPSEATLTRLSLLR